jgi:hypothetical protein
MDGRREAGHDGRQEERLDASATLAPVRAFEAP